MADSLRRLLRLPEAGITHLEWTPGTADLCCGTSSGEVFLVRTPMGRTRVRQCAGSIQGLGIDEEGIVGLDDSGRWWRVQGDASVRGGPHRMSGDVQVIARGDDVWVVGEQREGLTAWLLRNGVSHVKLTVPEKTVVRVHPHDGLQLVRWLEDHTIEHRHPMAGERFSSMLPLGARVLERRGHLVALFDDKVMQHRGSERLTVACAHPVDVDISEDGSSLAIVLASGEVLAVRDGATAARVDPGGLGTRVALDAAGGRLAIAGEDLSLWQWRRAG